MHAKEPLLVNFPLVFDICIEQASHNQQYNFKAHIISNAVHNVQHPTPLNLSLTPKLVCNLFVCSQLLHRQRPMNLNIEGALNMIPWF